MLAAAYTLTQKLFSSLPAFWTVRAVELNPQPKRTEPKLYWLPPSIFQDERYKRRVFGRLASYVARVRQTDRGSAVDSRLVQRLFSLLVRYNTGYTVLPRHGLVPRQGGPWLRKRWLCECMMSTPPPPTGTHARPPALAVPPKNTTRTPSLNPASSLRSVNPLRQTQQPGDYFWKRSDEHQTYLDFEEQLMIAQELKEQGLVRYVSHMPQQISECFLSDERKSRPVAGCEEGEGSTVVHLKDGGVLEGRWCTCWSCRVLVLSCFPRVHGSCLSFGSIDILFLIHGRRNNDPFSLNP